jgi:hypothetical protein
MPAADMLTAWRGATRVWAWCPSEEREGRAERVEGEGLARSTGPVGRKHSALEIIVANRIAERTAPIPPRGMAEGDRSSAGGGLFSGPYNFYM